MVTSGANRARVRDSVGAVVSDLVRSGVSPELVGRVVEILISNGASAAARQPNRSSSADEPSGGALRTRRWRARHASRGDVTVTRAETESDQPVAEEKPGNAGVSGRSAVVVGVVNSVTRRHGDVTGDGGDKKENPPHPLKKKLNPLSPKKGVSPSASPERIQHRPNWRHETEPVFREVEAIRGRSLPRDKRGGWEIAADLLAQAEVRLTSRVTFLRPPQPHAGAPPGRVRSG